MIRSVSYGGGVQSTALLVLAAQRRIDFPLFLMANVGDDSEHPATLEYVRNTAAPYAAEHGIELVVLERRRKDGTVETLWQKLMDPRPCRSCGATGKREDEPCERCEGTGSAESRSLPIPVRMSNGAPGTRSCTADFKIAVVGKELRRRGAHGPRPCREHLREQRAARRQQREQGAEPTALHVEVGCDECTPANQAVVGIGISLDEIGRANTRRVSPWERVVYPLVGVGEETGLKLTRLDCERVIRDAGLPVPPKSSCFFCPFHRPGAWEDLHRERPDLFERSALLEDTLNERRERLGKGHVYLTRFGVPLREAIVTDQPLLPLAGGDGACDSGWCFT